MGDVRVRAVTETAMHLVFRDSPALGRDTKKHKEQTDIRVHDEPGQIETKGSGGDHWAGSGLALQASLPLSTGLECHYQPKLLITSILSSHPLF